MSSNHSALNGVASVTSRQNRAEREAAAKRQTRAGQAAGRGKRRI